MSRFVNEGTTIQCAIKLQPKNKELVLSSNKWTVLTIVSFVIETLS